MVCIPQINNKVWIVLPFCLMNYNLKVIRKRQHIQHGFTSKECKIQVATIKNGAVLNLFYSYSKEDNSLPDFIANWI
jgi:hypothetical protein